MSPARVAAVAGSDPGMKAGLQTDRWAAKALGCDLVSIEAIQTRQDGEGLAEATARPPSGIASALRQALEEEVGAVKLGALGNQDAVLAVVEVLADFPDCPVVWDPVRSATRTASPGALLLNDEGWKAATSHLLPRVTLATPNLGEYGDGREWAGCLAVLVTGGHGSGPQVQDSLHRGDGPVLNFEGPRVPGGEAVHGTGCALSTAIACFLAQGRTLESSAREAVGEIREWLRSGFFLTR